MIGFGILCVPVILQVVELLAGGLMNGKTKEIMEKGLELADGINETDIWAMTGSINNAQTRSTNIT